MPADAFAMAELRRTRYVASAPDTTFYSGVRETMKLPTTPAASVTYVTDNTVCSRAEASYSAAASTVGTRSGWVRVIKVGNYYVVADTGRRAGEFTVTMTLSKSYRVLAQYTR